MLAKSCSRSHGQPEPGVRSAAMISRSREISREGIIEGPIVNAGARTLAEPAGGRDCRPAYGHSHKGYYGIFLDGPIFGGILGRLRLAQGLSAPANSILSPS